MSLRVGSNVHPNLFYGRCYTMTTADMFRFRITAEPGLLSAPCAYKRDISCLPAQEIRQTGAPTINLHYPDDALSFRWQWDV